MSTSGKLTCQTESGTILEIEGLSIVKNGRRLNQIFVGTLPGDARYSGGGGWIGELAVSSDREVPGYSPEISVGRRVLALDSMCQGRDWIINEGKLLFPKECQPEWYMSQPIKEINYL